VVAATLVVAAAFAAGVGAGELLRERTPPVVVRAPAAPAVELLQLRQQLEQARMALRVADARSQELEKQIDELNQKLTESQDELTFFRKAREGKKH
jgi:septal ring factor EnvC (AmiA/AmiB activator)